MHRWPLRLMFAVSLVGLANTPAAAVTLDCTFGDSIGVGLRDGEFAQGSKPGSQRIVFQQTDSEASGVRKAPDDPDRPARVVETDIGWQFVVMWDVTPVATIEVTTIAKQGPKRVGGLGKRPAVRTLQFMDAIGAPTATIDYGHCEVAP